MKKIFYFLKKFPLVISIALIFMIVPFFWMKPGQMDLGGDATRLYFYDPFSYLINDGLYYFDASNEGIRAYEPHFYNIFHSLFLLALKEIVVSPYILISLYSGIKISLGFVFTYLIIKVLINNLNKNNKNICEVASILGGVFYVLSPAMIENYDKALLSHNQVFLNPLIFFLLLNFFLTRKFILIWLALLISFVFAPNFSWIAAPPFFAFYPMSVLFIFFYVVFIRKNKIYLRDVFIGMSFFVGLHAFHLIPQLFSLLGGSSYSYERVFNAKNIEDQVNYFYSVLSYPKLSSYFFSDSSTKYFHFLSVIFPLVSILGLVLVKDKKKTLILVVLFFLIILFLMVGKVTNLGPVFYSKLFYLPGFTMFRNFTGQWQFVYFFYFALLFGLSSFEVLNRFRRKKFFIGSIIAVALVLGSIRFFTGELANKFHTQSNNVKIAFDMDPSYERVLSYVKNIPVDTNILSFPFSDGSYSVVYGKNDGAYVGPSPLTYLLGRRDYNGYLIMSPFSNAFIEAVKKQDFVSIKQLISLLNVQYIFYNSDPKAYENNFPQYPFQYMREYMPKNQKEYNNFIKKLGFEEVFVDGYFHVYKVKLQDSPSTFYVGKSVTKYQDIESKSYERADAFVAKLKVNKRGNMYIANRICNNNNDFCSIGEKTGNSNPKLYFERINPMKYKIKVSDASNPFILVFSQTFSSSWNLFFSPTELKEKSIVVYNDKIMEGKIANTFINKNTFETVTMKQISKLDHVIVNGYANAWVINPKELDDRRNFTLVLENVEQRFFYVGLTISLIVFIGFLLWGIALLFPKCFDIMKGK